MIQRIRDTGDELILYNDQHELLRVTGPTRLLDAAYGGVHVLPGGLLVVAGIVSQSLVVEPGGSCYATGYVGVVPKVAEGGLLDVSGHLDPARWPEAAVGGTILIAAGTRYKKHVVTADGTLVPFDPTKLAKVNDSSPRFRIIRSGPTPILKGRIQLAL